MTSRLRRSLLYTPADDREMMEKSLDSEADAVIFDLEDAIPEAAVTDSRDRIRDVVADIDTPKEICSRINGAQTPLWREDLVAVAPAVDTVILPMVERVTQLESFVDTATDAPGETPEFVLTVETPRGVFNAHDLAEYAAELDAVTAFSFGFGDYTNAIGATGRPRRVHEFLSHISVGAAAIGALDPLATVYQDFRDLEGLREAAEAAKEIGYVGHKAIHPAQVPVLNDVFTPSDEEVTRARSFVDGFDRAERDSLVIDGVFLDTAIVEQYRTVIDRYEEVHA